MDSNAKGNVAELKIAAAAADLGIPVLRPMTEHERYDLVFELGGRLERVQCKWGAVKDGIVQARIGGSYHSPARGYVLSTYDSSEIDLLAIYAAAIDRCFAVPIEKVAGLRSIHLRLDPPRNGQRGAINWASDYELGAVAQLAERSAGSRKVGGSNPPSSTQEPAPETVGAHVFRNHFGWYAQRASAGETFAVTRRGKPFVTLGPPGGIAAGCEPDADPHAKESIRLPLMNLTVAAE